MFSSETAMCSHIPNKGEQMVRYYGYPAMSHGKNGKRKERTISFPAFSNRKGIQTPSGKAGHD